MEYKYENIIYLSLPYDYSCLQCSDNGFHQPAEWNFVDKDIPS